MYVMAIPLKQSALLSDYNILAARLLVSVMDDKNVHVIERGLVSAARSGSSCPLHYGGYGLRQDLHIEPNRPLIHILKIKFHPMIKSNIAASIYLPKAGDARTYAESPSLPVFAEPLIIPHGQRTRPHQTHFSSENIKKL